MYLMTVHSSYVVKSGRWSLWLGFLRDLRVNSCKRYALSSILMVEFHHVITYIIGGTAICILVFWQSMNQFQRKGVSAINTASILGYIEVTFRTFKICWNTYFFNYLYQTWPQGRHFVHSSIALCSKSLTLPTINTAIVSKLQIALMGFPRFGSAFHIQTSHLCT
jgi:hypothetical protein